MIGIQQTIYLYWVNYPEFSDIQEAVKFAQKIYMGEHRNTLSLISRYAKFVTQKHTVEEKKSGN